jgi:hypothetical protein
MLKWFLIILLFLSMSPVSASTESYAADDTAYLEVADIDPDLVIPYILLQGIDPQHVSYLSIDTDTFNFTTNLSVSTLHVTADYQYEDKTTGNITSESDSWFKIPFMKVHFDFGNAAEGMYPGSSVFDSSVRGGSASWPHVLVEGPVYPCTEFTFESDAPVDIRWHTINVDSVDIGFYDGIKTTIGELIQSVPYIGEYVYQVLSIVGSITSAFVILAYISIKNWTFFLVLFESFVFFHATSIMQNKQGKSSALITESFKAIASDNKLLLDLLVNVSTQIINMFVGAVRMFRG